jgi:hypothetical protein
MKYKYSTFFISFSLAILTGCTTTAPQPWDHPVVLDSKGAPAPELAVEACLTKAKYAGLTPLLPSGSAMQPVEKNQAYRDMVQNCIREKGLVLIGWN